MSQENLQLRKSLGEAIEKSNQWNESELANDRLRSLLNFQTTNANKVMAAEVIGKDPSAWFKTIIIDKGESDGLKKGLPVVIAQGITGQIVDTADHYRALKAALMHEESGQDPEDYTVPEMRKRIVELDQAYGNGPKLTALVNRYAPQYGHITFHTAWDELAVLTKDEGKRS